MPVQVWSFRCACLDAPVQMRLFRRWGCKLLLMMHCVMRSATEEAEGCTVSLRRQRDAQYH
eukprot:scaffold77263_cov21-Tisochrysis_lutea.AAC.1